MDLYQPLYVPRPEVKLDLFASLRPQTYGQDLAGKEQLFRSVVQEEEEEAVAAGFRGGMGGMAAGKSRALPSRALAAAAAPSSPQVEMLEGLDVMILRGRGVQSVAQAADLGSLFQYKIDTPVSLPRQQSAMMPIVTADVKGEKVSIYNQNVHVKHPLSGLQFTNTTGLHLMQGPITVFDGGSYAGDAKIEDLPPGAERLISYAVDLDTEVAPQSKGQPEELLSVKLHQGHNDRQSQVCPRDRIYSEKFGQGGEKSVDRVSAGCLMETDQARKAG